MNTITYPMPHEWPYATPDNQNRQNEELVALEKPEPKLPNGGLNYVW